MGPEILIVGDRTQRGSLLPRVQDLGYLVTPVRERELTARVEANPAPVAVLVCLGDEDPESLIDAVRRGRDDVPVILYGSLGGAIHDLADVLELGADHFLAEPVGDEELASVLAELAGPGGVDDEAGEREGGRESVLPITPGAVSPADPGPLSGPTAAGAEGDPMLGQLHRTLEILAARLHPEEEEGDRDEIELAELGLDAVPDVDAGAGQEELDPDRVRRDPGDQGRRPETTLRLTREPSGPRRAAPTRTPNLGRAREASGPQPAARTSPRRQEAVREDRSGPGGTTRLSGRDVREDRSGWPGPGATTRLASGREEAVREDRPGPGATPRLASGREEAVREDRSGPGATTRLASGREEAVREDRSGPGATTRLGGRDVREDRSGPGATTRLASGREEAVREDRSGPGATTRLGGRDVREDRPGWPGATTRLASGRGEAVREDRSGWPGASTRPPARDVREDRSDASARDDRSAGEATARVHVRRDVAALRPAAGEPLAGLEVVERLARLHRQRWSGRVTIGFTGGAVKEVWWRAGEPVFATSTAATDGLAARLVARGLIGRAEAAGLQVDGDVGAAARRLVAAGLLKPREQAEAVRDVVESIVLSLCSDGAARWSSDATPPPATAALGVPMATLLARGTRLGMSDERLREGLSEETCLQVQVEDPEALASALAEPEAAEWLALLDGSRSLAELVDEDGIDARALWVAGCVLRALGQAAEVDAGASLAAIDRRRVHERLALAQAADYFALLGVSRSASRAEVSRAHGDLRATFAPERLEPASRAALAEDLRELQAALDEARDVLLDEALRAAYAARLAEDER